MYETCVGASGKKAVFERTLANIHPSDLCPTVSWEVSSDRFCALIYPTVWQQAVQSARAYVTSKALSGGYGPTGILLLAEPGWISWFPVIP